MLKLTFITAFAMFSSSHNKDKLLEESQSLRQGLKDIQYFLQKLNDPTSIDEPAAPKPQSSPRSSNVSSVSSNPAAVAAITKYKQGLGSKPLESNSQEKEDSVGNKKP